MHPQQSQAGLCQDLELLPVSLQALLQGSLCLGGQSQGPGVVVDGGCVGQATMGALPTSTPGHLPYGQDIIPLCKHHLFANPMIISIPGSLPRMCILQLQLAAKMPICS